LTSEAYHKGLEAAASAAEEKSNSITSSLSSIGKGIAVGGLALLTGGIVEATHFMGESVSAAEDVQNIQAQLGQVLKNTGSITGVTSEQVEGLAEKYSGLTKFSDETILSAGGVLARFKDLKSDAFPGAMEAAMNLSQTMGTDLSSSAQLLGKILEQPGTAMMRLRAAGVEVTPALDNMLKKMDATGDTAGAQAAILDALSKSIGGTAEAAGQTASGKMAILDNKFEEIKEKLGAGLLPAITSVGSTLATYLNNPATQAGITNIANGIAAFAQTVITNIPVVINWFTQAFDFLKNNQGIVVGVLAALGVAVAIFGVTAAASLWEAMAPLLPAMAIMAAVGLAAYALYQAWTTDFGGIREIVASVWAWLQPILQKLWDWLQTTIPLALAWLKNAWETVLLPAITRVWDWITANLFPLFTTMWNWLQVNVPAAIQTLTDFWTNTLLPAINSIWSFIQTYLIPIFTSIADIVGRVVVIAVTALQGAWENVLLPAITKIHAFINDKLQPIFKTIADFINEKLGPAVKWLSDNVFKPLADNLMGGVKTALEWVADKLSKLKDFLDGFKLPAWLTPGSPTPFEHGLVGIHKALTTLNNSSLPQFHANLNFDKESMIMPAMAAVTAASGVVHNSRSDQFNLTVNPHYYRGSEPTMSEEVNMLQMQYGVRRS
jgi:hypothetical protein